ncbi:hypothetical protein [Arenicella xantha]|uniref:Outer membrane lipoprotein-sorting protein n=1 Tax=Arenicella xantha TaxID=644221 RepID=A0A395JQ31_9GAMM|nr:hypothetical protein [Arenicella xantha]RBP53627.1 hypothetical protein DFR28_1011014 [Arenicella xantha]
MKLTLASLLVATLVSIEVHAAQPELIGKVYDIQTQALLYQETHSFADTTLKTSYTDASGNVIGQREVQFKPNGQVNAYQLTQQAAAITESVERKQQSIDMSVSAAGKQTQQEIDISQDDEVVIDAGFSNFLLRNWQNLLAGKKVTTRFASTAQMDLIKVQLNQVDPQTSSLADNGDTTGIVMFQMRLANPLIRWLISPIEVGYYADTKQIAYYQGASNLSKASGEHYGDVRVIFERQPQEGSINAE